MYHLAEFGEAGERSYPGRCNPHAWLKSGAIQPAKWYPFPAPRFSPHRLLGPISPRRRHAHSPFRLPPDPVCSGMKVLLFDTFGTLVDWRASLIATLTDFSRKKGRQLPAAEMADRWRAAYEPM